MSHTLSGLVAARGLTLPDPVQPDTAFLLHKRIGDLVFISGQVSRFDDRHIKGKVGRDLTVDQACEAARLSALNILVWLARSVDDRQADVAQCVRLGGFVACTPEFTDHSRVIGAASDLIVDVLSERGRHARIATGAPSLPFDYAVSIDAIFELRPIASD